MTGARILLVEDDAVLRDVLRHNLEARQHEVRIADDAQSALDALRADVFDLIILDINLPDQTGWDVLRIAQREGSLLPRLLSGDVPLLPVVVVSAVRVSLSRLKEFPLLAYLPKPFPMEALLRLAEEAAERRQRSEHFSVLPYHPQTNVHAPQTNISGCRNTSRQKGDHCAKEHHLTSARPLREEKENMNGIVLDIIVVVVSVASFAALIAFTVGCERL